MSHIQVFFVLFLSVLQTYLSADEEPNLLTRLDCQPPEKRVFAYESNTQLWGPLDENFLVSADITVHCLGTDEKGKYGKSGHKYMVQIENLRPSVVKEKQNEIRGKRSKRGVGTWFKQAWIDVKEFFVGLFTKRRRNDGDFSYDFEKEPSSLQYQCKNKNGNRRKRAVQRSGKSKSDLLNYDKMFSTPFVFIQLADGSIPEVRFSDQETDPTVKNFKRHIADAFATQLDASKQRVLEKSPIGAHFSSYSYDNTGKMEESLQPTADGQSLQLGTFMSLSQTKDLNHLSVMRDVTPEDMMEIGSNGMTYDASQIGVNAKQIQQISEGRVTTTAGHLSLSLINPTKTSRTKRNTKENKEIEDYLKVRTKYSLGMTKRIGKRSADDKQILEALLDRESKLNLKGEAMISESTTENTLKESLMNAKKNINENLEAHKSTDNLLKYLSDKQSPIYNSLMKALNLEIMLNEDKTHSSVTHMISDKINENKINDICGRKLSLKNKNCFDLMMLLIKGQSTIAQTLLITQLRSDISLEDKNDILKLLVQSPNPQNSLFNQLFDILRAQTNQNYEGILLIAISNIGFRSKSNEMRAKIAEILTNKLNSIKCDTNQNNSLFFDTLEAIGNLGNERTIPYILRVDDTCPHSDSIRIAAIHSCRRLLANPEIQKWFLKLIKERSNSCSVRQEVVNTLIDDINAMEMSMTLENRWPKTEFNEIDNILTEELIQIKHNDCIRDTVIRYFERKSDHKAKVVLKKVKKLRSKREVFDSFWTESHCKEWIPTEDKKETHSESDDAIVISDRYRESESMDQTMKYQKRKKCSASKRFGPSQAQAVFRADIVNDVYGNEENPDYKLMAQFVAGTHFLGKDIDIGKMYVYHKKDASRAYVNIFGNTLVDLATTDCNGTNLQPYIYSNSLPLYDFSVWVVQMTLGVRMTAEMNFDLPRFNCGNKQTAELQTVNISPETKVRAAGEVSGKVLVIRGGMNIGGDFNYFSNLKFEPSHELCLSVDNGYNPMNVSINSWYQFWHPSCGEWMDRSVWSPVELNWQINEHHRSAWIENECLIKESKSKSKRIDP